MDNSLYDIQIVKFPANKKLEIFRYNEDLKRELNDKSLYLNRTYGNMFMLLSGKQLKNIEKIETIKWYISIDDSGNWVDYPCDDDDFECPIVHETTCSVEEHIRKIDYMYNLIATANTINAYVGSEYLFNIMLRVEFTNGKVKNYEFGKFLDKFMI